MTIKTAVPAQAARRIQRRDYILPALVALAGASAAIAGADTTFDPALTQFTLQLYVHHMFSRESWQEDISGDQRRTSHQGDHRLPWSDSLIVGAGLGK